MEEEINFFGRTTFRNENKKFGIKCDDRRRHVYVIGKTGMGKTNLLKVMAIQDIKNGHGVGFVDPHGEAAEELLEYVPKDRMKDVVYFNPADRDFPISFNVMENVAPELRHLVASGLMGVFKKIWPDVWSARMEYILHNCILALLEHPTTTLLGINRMLSDSDYRSLVVEGITDPVIKAFWTQEFSRYTQRYEVEATAAIQNKIGQFISSPLIRNIIGQVESSIDIRKLMDERKILIFNLSKGRIGEDCSKLLGGLLITKLQLAAMSRVDIKEEERQDFFLYVDEFQNFATESFTNILSEARKYRLSLILGHQYIAQMEDPVRDAVFGNVGTLITFRVGAEDAEFLEREFQPYFTAQDLVNLPKWQIYLKLIVDGVAGNPFSAQTLEPFSEPEKSYKNEIINFCRGNYASPREIVEKRISKWSDNFAHSNKEETKKEVEMFEVQCKECGKWTRVPFKPKPDRPVYCKTCLKKLENEKVKQPEKEEKQPEKEEKQPEKEEKQLEKENVFSLEQLLTKKPISFSKKQQERKELDKEKLKQVLRDSLKDSKKQKIEPGDTIKF